MTFKDELTSALNRYSAENRSNTPDFILAKYLIGCLNAFDVAVNMREDYYGREHHHLGSSVESPSLETVALCPHGMPLADNVCGPCSEGRPTVNRGVNDANR